LPDVERRNQPDCEWVCHSLRLIRKQLPCETSGHCKKGIMPRRNGGTELSDFEETKAKLVEDLKLVAEDAEELIKATGGELGEKTREIRDRLKFVLEDAKETCAKLEDHAVAGFRTADQTIRKNPYSSIGIALGAGLLIGFLLKRR
jgi:ElaB/YqjD/DUF883 family membrane-anchored ribosome-binding protein